MEAARCMLQDAGIEKRYWSEAVNTAIFIKNKSPSKAVRDSTPKEKGTGKRVDLSNFRVFGCTAYALVPNERRKKLDAKSKKYIFGYCNETKGYRLVDPENPSKCIKSRDVQFIEERFNKESKLNQNNNTTDGNLDLSSNVEQVERGNSDDSDEIPTIDISDSSLNSSDICDHDPTDITWNPDMTSDGGSSSEDFKESSENIAAAIAMTATNHNEESQSIQEALSGPEKEHWKTAIMDEYMYTSIR